MLTGVELELGMPRRARECLIRALGSCFIVLAAGTTILGLVALVHGFLKATLIEQAPDETLRTVVLIGVPLVVSLLLGWLQFRLGQGLRKLTPLARSVALVLLVPACVPPLVVFFHAVRAGALPEAALSLLGLAVLAGASLLLGSAGTDCLFSPEYRAISRDPPHFFPNTHPGLAILFRVLIMVIGTIVAILILARNRS